jgi:predicted dehydrogenase
MAKSISKCGKLGVGVIGVGIGKLHLQGYTESPDAEIIALCDIDEPRAKRAAEKFSVPKIYADYHELLADDRIDAVSVAVPNYLHAPMVIDAFAAGKHVICEKPLTIDQKDGEAMIEAGKKAGKLFMTAFNNRFRGDTQVLKTLIENGELGNIYYGKTGWLRRKGIPGMGGWFTTKAKSGGGPLIDIGVHVLDLALWLMGNPKAVSVTGSTYAEFGPKGEGMSTYGNPEAGGCFDVEDLASAFIRLDSGATLVLEASWASHIKEDDRIYTELMGTKGGAKVAPLAVYKDMYGRPVDITPSYQEMVGHTMEIKHFVDCIVNGTKLISTGEHGLEVVRILNAIYKSAREHKEISLR